MSSVPRSSRPTRGLSFWILVAILAFSPFPLGSIGAEWSYLYGALISVALIAYVLDRWRSSRAIPVVSPILMTAAALVATVALWGYAQAIPGLLPDLQHPFWAQTAELLGIPDMKGYLSLAPERSVQVATGYLIYLGFALLVIWHSRRQRNVELLLKIFVGVQALYALYGLTMHFLGVEAVLWFDKPGASARVTSTFVNRNNYATYAGLGALAAAALVLRYLRHTLAVETSRRVQIRNAIETVTSYGWLLPVTLALLFVAILLSQSRMGLFAILCATAVMLGGWAARLPQGRARTFGTALLILLVGFVSVNFFLSGGATAERFARFVEEGDVRFQVYPLILDAISDRPWLGFGLGSFDTAFRAYRDETIPVLFMRGHSDYLELVMDVGWPAAMAMFTAFVLVLVLAWRSSRVRREYELALLSIAATIQIGIHSATDFSMQLPAVVYAYLFVALVGIGSARVSNSDDSSEGSDAGMAPKPSGAVPR